MSNDYQSGVAPSAQKSHAEIIAECYHNTAATRYVRKLLERLEAAHRRELDALNEQITDLRQQRDLWSKRAAELVEKCDEQYAKLKQVGNATKLREAIIKAEAVLDGIRLMVLQGQEYDIHLLDIDGALKKCRAALAAPPRNCDRYNDRVEMYGVFKDWCNARGHTMEPKLAYDAFEWLLATATEKEGGNDADK